MTNLTPDNIKFTNFDFAIQTVIDKFNNGEIKIANFQSSYPWNLKSYTKPSRFIESLLLGLPTPSFYFVEKETLAYEVIDGHQRIITCQRFFNNEFRLENLEVRTDLNGKLFRELPISDREKTRKRGVRVVIFDDDLSKEMRTILFKRLNNY